MTKCPNCNTEVWPSMRKCFNCGTEMPKEEAKTEENVAGVTSEGETVTPQDAVAKVQEIADAAKTDGSVKIEVKDEDASDPEATTEEKSEATE